MKRDVHKSQVYHTHPRTNAEGRTPTPREIAASIERATRFGDPIVGYADSDSPNLWVDVHGKVDSLKAPIKDFGMVPTTIHPTASDDDEVTRVWYRPLNTLHDQNTKNE